MFIASQGPLSNTTEDFWEMINNLNVKLIVMLCELKEKGCVIIDFKIF